MKSVLRMRHYCDYCKKAGQSSYHMSRHEKRCTLSPVRHCRMCERLDIEQRPIADLLAVLPSPADHQRKSEYSNRMELNDESIRPLIAAAMPALRGLTEGCPVCVMAAFRQKGIPVPMAEGFDFTAEMKSLWSDINNDERNY